MWKKGRQKGFEYYKFKLWKFKFLGMGFDAYILKYPNIGELPEHVDEVENGKHYRFNLNLKGKNTLFITKDIGLHSKSIRIIYSKHKSYVSFRPDRDKHYLNVYSPSLKLTFGFVKFNK